VTFPFCWDGQHLDVPDHRSHVAYPSGGGCPASHPVRLPTLALRLRWKAIQAVPSSQLSFASGGQFSLHADFWNAWDPAGIAWLVANCVNEQRDCNNVTRDQIQLPSSRATQAPTAAPSSQ